MHPTSSTRQVGFHSLELEFTVPDTGIAPTHLATALSALEHALTALHSAEPVDTRLEHSDYWEDGHFSAIRIVGIQMASPLMISARLPRLSKNTIKAVTRFLQNLIFFEQERELRSARAAEAWERVYAARIQNVQAVLEVLADTGLDPELKHRIAHTLIQSSFAISETPIQLKSIRFQGE